MSDKTYIDNLIGLKVTGILLHQENEIAEIRFEGGSYLIISAGSPKVKYGATPLNFVAYKS